MKWSNRLLIGIPYGWLLLFFMLPFLIVMKISVSEVDGVMFKDLFTWADGVLHMQLKFSNYFYITQDNLYFTAYLTSLKYAAITTVLCLLIGYPFAYFMARSNPAIQPALLMMLMLPFWTSFLLRVYAWKGLLVPGGWVATVLGHSGVDPLLVDVIFDAQTSGGLLLAVPGDQVSRAVDLLLQGGDLAARVGEVVDCRNPSERLRIAP